MTVLAEVEQHGLMKMGMSGAPVRTMQLALKSVGFPLTGTGYFGAATDTAVEAFQRRAGLKEDGIVGRETARALDAAQSPEAAVIPANSHKEIGRPLWLEAGLQLIGTKETPGAKDNPTIIDWAKQEGGLAAREYTHDSIPWCALFINHILTKADLKGTETLWALDFAGKWPCERLAGPAVGAIAPMLRNGGGHVICVVGRDQHGNIMGLGGNQSDQVSIVPFPFSRLNKGFWWPDSVPLPEWTGINTLPIVRSNGQLSSNEA